MPTARELTAYANLYQSQQVIQNRYNTRLQQLSSNQAAVLSAYDRNTQILSFPNGGTRNSRPVNNSSQSLNGVLPLVTMTPNGVFVGSR